LSRRFGVVAVCAALLAPSGAQAKDFGVKSPSGRQIYGLDETFGEVLDQNRRVAVVEVTAGAGPEGTIGMLLGWLLPRPFKGLELYAGVGIEANPAVHFTGTVRYYANLWGYRPFVALGYLYQIQTAILTHSHHVFAEAGYKWVLAHTYHLHIGAGVRYMAHLAVLPDSPLHDPDVDRDFLDRELKDTTRWLPTVAVRFSRAF
jgi:hypothetical protein